MEKIALTEYTEGSGGFNRPLRGYDGSWKNFKGVNKVDWNNEGKKQEIINATSAISRSKAKKDMWLVRGWSSIDGIGSFLGMSYYDIMNMTKAELDANFLGKVFKDEGFFSCGTAKGTGFTGYLIANIYCPKGTQLIYAEPFSYYNGSQYTKRLSRQNLWDGKTKYTLEDELETIIQRGTQFRVTNIYIDSTGQLRADLEVVGQI